MLFSNSWLLFSSGQLYSVKKTTNIYCSFCNPECISRNTHANRTFCTCMDLACFQGLKMKRTKTDWLIKVPLCLRFSKLKVWRKKCITAHTYISLFCAAWCQGCTFSKEDLMLTKQWFGLFLLHVFRKEFKIKVRNYYILFFADAIL